MEWFRVRWKFDNCLAVNCVEKSGGLALFWNNTLDLRISSYSKKHIDAFVNDDNLYLVRGALRPDRQMSAFHNAVVDCNFNELPVEGPLFTWHRGVGNDMILERLDRALVSSTWMNLFLLARERHLVSIRSDHLPILVEVFRILYANLGRKYDRREDIMVCQQQIRKLECFEEVMWKQRSMDKWVREGDKIAGYFHSLASAKKGANFILRLRLENEVEQSDH
ncbi:hypothetical protein PTKIN_Ptkin19aG0027000 [Pterospermum kingtungense]